MLCPTCGGDHGIWSKIDPEKYPGVYGYHPHYEAALIAEDMYLWNVVAVQKLDAMYDRLNIPQHLRR